MSSLENIRPLDPLLWINDKPLLSLTYLWHLSQEDLSENGKVDLLWKLTKQLLIAVYHEKDYVVEQKELHTLLAELEKEPSISALLKNQVINSETLLQILSVQEIDFLHQQKVLKDFQKQLSEDDKDIREYYESRSDFDTKNTYEVYEYLGEENLISLSRQSLLAFPSENLEYFGSLQQEELDQLAPLKKRTLPEVIPHPHLSGKFLLIKAFHNSYKAPYEVVKSRLVSLFAHSMTEQKIEEEAQQYLGEASIKYNEPALEQILQLTDLWK